MVLHSVDFDLWDGALRGENWSVSGSAGATPIGQAQATVSGSYGSGLANQEEIRLGGASFGFGAVATGELAMSPDGTKFFLDVEIAFIGMVDVRLVFDREVTIAVKRSQKVNLEKKLLRFLLRLIRPPSAAEWKAYWKGILPAAAFACFLLLVFSGQEEKTSLFWFILELLFAYIVSFITVIGHRIEESENRK